MSKGILETQATCQINELSFYFIFYQESNELYGDYFSSVSDPLSSLFKKAYGLQKSLMALLDTVQISRQDGDEVIGKMIQGELLDMGEWFPEVYFPVPGVIFVSPEL